MQFVLHFNYCPKFPPDLYFDQEVYADLLLKCIEDDFDYDYDDGSYDDIEEDYDFNF